MLCQEVPGGTGNFGTYLPKSEQKDVLFFKIMPKTTRQKLKSQCPNVFPCINIVNAKNPIFKLVAPRVGCTFLFVL